MKCATTGMVREIESQCTPDPDVCILFLKLTVADWEVRSDRDIRSCGEMSICLGRGSREDYESLPQPGSQVTITIEEKQP